MKAALDILLTAPEFDLVLAVVGSSARFHPELAVQADHRQRRRRPSRSPPSWYPKRPRRWRDAGRGRRAEFPHAGGLRRRHRGGAVARARARGRLAGSGSGMRRIAGDGPACSTSSKPTRCSTALGIPHAPAVALDAGITQAPALPFPYPVAVKVAVRRDRAQDRCRRRGARMSGRRRADRRDPQDRRHVASDGQARASSACWCSR